MLHQKIINLDEEDPKNSLKNSAMSRIQNDLNSPSANIRLRAIKALKSPSIIYYNNFDVPHQLEDIDFNEGKRLHHFPPLDIKEVMKKVIVYVEIRTGEENHSAGIKKVISQLGAIVNNTLLRNTTHVIFKDGLQSTYNKAKKWQIPIVSILWIEACKKHIKVMDSKLYPISNQDRYENPELYDKIKRIKYMNLDTDENYNRIKVDNAKNVNTPKKIRCSVRMPKKPRDSLNEIFVEFQEKLKATADDDDDEFIPFQSKLLERIRNSPCKTVTESKSTEKILNRRKSIHTINKTKQLDNNKTKISTPQLKTSNRKSCIGFAMSNPSSTKTTSFTSKNKTIPTNINLQKKMFDFFPKQKDDLISYNELLDKSEKKENMCPGTPEMYGKIKTSKCMEMKNSKIDKLEVTVTPKNNYTSKRISTPIHSKYNNNKDITDQLDTIIEDIPDTIIFNSTKKPSSRRKTIFECSMDILDQSLHHFNKLSKMNKSLADEKENPIEILSNPSNKIDNCTAVESIKSFSSLNISEDVVGTPKKRKLFVPEQCILSTPTGKEIIIDNFKLKSIGSTVKRKIVEDNSMKPKKVNGKRRRTINICSATANTLQ